MTSILDRFRTLAGLFHSWRVYRAGAARRVLLDRFYRRFLGPDDLAFDVGAHVGDRTACFRRLGARVIAFEPQDAPRRFLRLMHGRDPLVTVLDRAAASREGTLRFHLNVSNPTVATASKGFIEAARGQPGWEGQAWTAEVEVQATTLDAEIARHGEPRFVKIDVEGFEAEVLSGLSRAVPALSFEFTTIERGVAQRCLARLSELGYRSFNASLGESLAFVLPRPVDATAIGDWLEALPIDANSGDVYAALDPRVLEQTTARNGAG